MVTKILLPACFFVAGCPHFRFYSHFRKMSRLVCAIALAALFSAVPIAHGRRRLQQDIICSVVDGLCAASCNVAGGSYYKYNCNSDSCRSSTNPVGACFPGDATVETPNGPKPLNHPWRRFFDRFCIRRASN